MNIKQKFALALTTMVLTGIPLYIEYLYRYTEPTYRIHLKDGSTIFIGCLGVSRL